MTPEEFDKIVQQAREIAFGKDGESGKHALYNPGNTHFYKTMGFMGRCYDIWRKAIRFVAAMKRNNFVHLREDALDLLNYTVMFCIVYDEEYKKEDPNDTSAKS